MLINERVITLRKRIRMNTNGLLLSVMLAFVSSCSGKAYSAPDRQWSIRVAMPSFYPVSISQAYGINGDQDWTSPIHNMLSTMSTSRLSSVRKRIPNYDGYGIPIDTFTSVLGRQVSGTNQLPDTIIINWVSLTNIKFYLTKLDLSEEIKRIMSSKVSYARPNGTIENLCFRTEVVFGLLPDGRAKVFVKGCGELIYIAELEPERVMDHDSHGFGADDYKKRSYLKRIQTRAEEAGVSIDPIPWDKVNKVYSSDKITQLN